MTCRKCDLCGGTPAPFGYAPPPALAIKIRRPLYACAAQACRDQAEAKRTALIARHDPLRRDGAEAAPDPARQAGSARGPAARDPRQPGLGL